MSAQTDTRTFNPGNVDTTLPTIQVRITPYQANEVYDRLVVTAETDELPDWGWLEERGKTVRILHIVDDPECTAAGVTDAVSDLSTMVDIAEDNARAWFAEPSDVTHLRSMRLLLRKATEAVEAAHAEATERTLRCGICFSTTEDVLPVEVRRGTTVRRFCHACDRVRTQTVMN